MKKVLLLTDNYDLLLRFKKLVADNEVGDRFHYAYSPNNKFFRERYKDVDWIKSIIVKNNINFLYTNYDLIISLHCKQIFPKELIKKTRCINIHPGLNPNNRGWYPQVFSIINGLPCGATIHEIDEELDHGPIICQKEVKIEMWDTSLSAYNKILDAEIELLTNNFENIIYNKYKTVVKEDGNLNLKKDFDLLCEIDLSQKDTYNNMINKLRALTHGKYENAYFKDDDGNRIFVKLELRKE